jgi:hypothetical protein
LGTRLANISPAAAQLAHRDNHPIPPGTRFQVSLPTPVAIAYSFAQPAACPMIAAAIERRMQIELDELFAVIPHADLAIQCFGRRDPATIPELLDLHALLAD